MSLQIPDSVTIHWDGVEPYLSPASHPGIRVTPFRQSSQDVDDLTTLCNFPEVGGWFFRRPFPFPREEAISYFDENMPKQAPVIEQLRKGAPTADSTPVSLLPFTVVRDATTGQFIGDLALFLTSPEDKSNSDSVTVPAPDQRWTLAYTLRPEYWGRGVGTAVVREIMSFAREYMGVHLFTAEIQTVNFGSTRLIQKLGFQMVKVYTETWPAEKGGDERELKRWELDL